MKSIIGNMENIFNYSIIIPHKNMLDSLQRCLNSIPRREDVQIIVVDDNSDADKVDFADFPGLNNPYVEVIFDKNENGRKGAGYARNLALERAKGKWLVFADADDFFMPCISKVFDKYKDDENDMIYFYTTNVNCHTLQLDTRDHSKTVDCLTRIKKTNNWDIAFELYPSWGKFIKRAMVERNNIGFSEYKYAEDVWFNTKCCLFAYAKIVADDNIYCRTIDVDKTTLKQTTLESLEIRFNSHYESILYLKKHNKIGIYLHILKWWTRIYDTNKIEAITLLPKMAKACGLKFVFSKIIKPRMIRIFIRAAKAIMPYGILKLIRMFKKRRKTTQKKDMVRIQNSIPKKELHFEIHLVEHCNLNCKYCSHFSPIAKESYLDTTAFDRDMERLAQITHKKLAYIKLMGGEPLLHPQCHEMMRIARKHFDRATQIILVTNGILLTKQNELFWQSAKNNNVRISITPYPIKLNIEAIKNLSIQYGVPCGYFNDKSFDDERPRIKTMHKYPLDLEGKQNGEQSFQRCIRANNCLTLQDGKLYTCCITPHIQHFNDFFGKHLLVTEQDYIDIYKAQSIEEILEFLSKPIPFCRYCNVFDGTTGHEWSVSKKEISEWV